MGVEQGSLIERVTSVQGDGAGDGFRTRVVEAGEQHVAHEDLGAFGDVEDNVHFAGVSGFDLLRDVDICLLKTTAQVVGEERVAITGQVLRRKQLSRRGIEQRSEASGIDMVVALNLHSADAGLPALINPVSNGKRSCALCG